MGRKDKPKRRGRHWTAEEMDALRAFSPEYSDRQIAILMDRTASGVGAMRCQMGLKRRDQPVQLQKPTEVTPDIEGTPLNPVLDKRLTNARDLSAPEREVLRGAVRYWMSGSIALAWSLLVDAKLVDDSLHNGYDERVAELCRLAADMASDEEYDKIHSKYEYQARAEEKVVREAGMSYSEMRVLASMVRGYGEGLILVCPVCQETNVHIQAIGVRTKPHSVIVTPCGVQLLPGQASVGGYGSGASIICWGECVHRFVYDIYFSKGQAYIKSTILEPLPEEPGATPGQEPPELWRD